jgi:small subunit ribosomal protein S3
MGQKVNPIGLRLGVNRTWESRWFAQRGAYADLLHEDLKIRAFLKERLRSVGGAKGKPEKGQREKTGNAGVSRIVIERPHGKCRITVYTARPGLVIGTKGEGIKKLREDLSAMVGGSEVFLNLVEVRKPEIDSQLVADGVAEQLSKRVAFRRAMKRAMQSAMRLGAQGIRITVAGRLGGAEIARTEWYREGRVPLHTLRADVDYATSEASTAYGIIGVKVWIFKGEIYERDPMAQDKRAQESGENRTRRDNDREDRPGRDRDDRGGERPRGRGRREAPAGA